MARLHPLIPMVLIGGCLCVVAGLTALRTMRHGRSDGNRPVLFQNANRDHDPIVLPARDIHHDDRQDVVLIDPDTPNRVRRLRFDTVGRVDCVQWSEDHAYLLLSSLKGTFLCRYHPGTREFDPPVVCDRLGANPLIRWPAGCTQQEEAIEEAVRKQVLQIFGLEAASTLGGYAWTPDRKQIAFAIDTKENSDEAGESYQEIWVADVPGLHLKRLGRGSHPHWSPNGQALVAIDGNAVGGRQIVRYDLPKGTRIVLRSGKLECFANVIYNASGDTLAVFGADNPAQEWNDGVFLMDPQGKHVRHLAEQGAIGGISYPVELSW